MSFKANTKNLSPQSRVSKTLKTKAKPTQIIFTSDLPFLELHTIRRSALDLLSSNLFPVC